MAEVVRAVGEKGERRGAPDRKLPIEDYDALTVHEVISRLEGLPPEELQAVRSYEVKHKNRKTLLRKLDTKLRQTDRD